MQKLDLKGITVAVVLPFDDELQIDWDSYKRVLDYCAVPDAITAVFVNGHAGEGALLSDDERQAVIERTRKHVGKPLLAGIIADSTAEAVDQVVLARQAGADCAVLFPPASLGGGASASSRAPVSYVRSIAEATDFPLSVFQYPIVSGMGFSTEALTQIAAIPQVVALKEGSGLVEAYDDNWRAVKKANPDLAFLPSNYNWFLPQLAIGADGILSGLISLVPHLFARLWDAAASSDLAAMRKVNDELHPIVRAIYGKDPLIDMHTRIKVGLKALNIIANDRPRPPLMPIEPEIGERIVQVVSEARTAGSILLKD